MATITAPRQMTSDDLIEMVHRMDTGINPNDVMEVRITPEEITALVFDLDSDGNKFLAGDGNGYSKSWQVIAKIA